MSEEEKEVLKTLKKGLGLTSAEQEILVNYIDKLQKENEELKEEIKDLIKENHKHIDYIADMKKKHEDKIRAKIKEFENQKEENIIKVLGELIDEE